jgi:hypothetical protein
LNYITMALDASELVTSNVALSARIWITISGEVRAYTLCVCALVRKLPVTGSALTPPVAGCEANTYFENSPKINIVSKRAEPEMRRFKAQNS